MARNKYPEETVRKILDVAERLFMERGYERTTMAACMCMSVVATSWLRAESPGTLVGKVMALTLMLANFAAPLGQLGYGVALDLVPAWAIALAAAGATSAVAAWLARSARG